MIPSILVLIFELPPQFTSHRCTFTWSYRRRNWRSCRRRQHRGFGHWTTSTQQMSTVQSTKRSCRWCCASTLRFGSCILKRLQKLLFGWEYLELLRDDFFDVMSTIKIMSCYAKQLHINMLFWSRICNLTSSIQFLQTLQPSLMMLSSKPKGGGSLCTA